MTFKTTQEAYKGLPVLVYDDPEGGFCELGKLNNPGSMFKDPVGEGTSILWVSARDPAHKWLIFGIWPLQVARWP